MLLSIVSLLTVLVTGPYAVYILLYWYLDPSECPAEKEMVTEPVSVVLPTYNEESIVESKLSELVDLSYPTELLEVVVVDSSTDATASEVRSFAAKHEEPDIRLVEEGERRGVASAVNMGVDAATHDVIFRTDCDSRIGDETIPHAVAALQDGDFGGVMGQQRDVLGESQVEEDYRGLQARNQALESHLDSTFIVHGPCFAFRKEYFEPIHPDSLADDTEVGTNVRRQGKRVVLDPEMEFTESGVSDLRGRRQRKDRRAMGLIQLLVRTRDMLGGHGNYGRVVLPFNWWFMVVAPWLMLAVVALAIGGSLFAFDAVGLIVPLLLIGFVALGQRDSLGPIQPLYAVFDSNVSLIIASLRLLKGGSDGTWEVDAESRDAFEE